MRRLFAALTVTAAVAIPCIASAQNKEAIEKAVIAVGTEWNHTYVVRDIDAHLATIGKPIGLFVYGGRAYAADSLKAYVQRVMSQRTNEDWTVDNAQVTVLGNGMAFLQMTFSGHYTTLAGVTWEMKSSAFLTALVAKQGGAWKIVAFQNSGAGTQVKK